MIKKKKRPKEKVWFLFNDVAYIIMKLWSDDESTRGFWTGPTIRMCYYVPNITAIIRARVHTVLWFVIIIICKYVIVV